MSSVLLALSMTSSQAVMAFFSEDALECIAATQWNNLGGTELAESLEDKYLSLMAQAPGVQIKKIFGVQGPGSFTGLRVSSAFLKGLATALNVPLVGIPTFKLYGEPICFSLRPNKAIELSVNECRELGYKFLEVAEMSSRVVEIPKATKFLGFVENPLWPSLDELQKGVRSCIDKESFDLDYGYTPEFKTS